MKKTTVLFTSLIAFLVFSCQKTEDLITLQEDPVASTQIVSTQAARINVEPNYLTFPDWKSFNETLQSLQHKSREQREMWEKEHKFTSLNTIYEYVVDEELSAIDQEEALLKENPALKKTLKHKKSSLGLANSNAITIGYEGVEINVFPYTYALLLNKDRVVKIGDVLIQVTKNETKTIKYDSDKSLSLLLNATQSDPQKNLYINNTSGSTPTSSKNAKVAGELRTDAYNGDGSLWLTAYSRTAKMCFFDASGASTSGYYTIAQMYIQMRFLRKTWYGEWVDHRSESYSTSGQWGQGISNYAPPLTGRNGGSAYAPVIGQFYNYNTGSNWFGKTANPSYTLWYADLETCFFAEPGFIPGTVHNFQFVDINSSITYN
jgi:hypothetical protein